MDYVMIETTIEGRQINRLENLGLGYADNPEKLPPACRQLSRS